MHDLHVRVLVVENGLVACLPEKSVTLDRCRFCVHSTHFETGGKKVVSPARAYCSRSEASDEVDLRSVTRVWCDDTQGEGFRSIMSIIS
ncbi:hypothetical protein RJ53_03765 [Methanocalculus chunghsingensis]|uniref:Uncharacterized protein n=1 Tax=Methanocalculus chunghsingensis TaxID=156457 RepID=A0A8J7W5H3_9EURY|nr:hypothetical protein [Methanocalculus chunghsingensis]MBR1368669.1 hypothetical protein [Methanocalculus chunghsingensis]